MGVFNILTVETKCFCGETVPIRLQFEFGDCWHNEYRLGDKLRWGGNDKGIQGAKKVLVEAVSEDCPNCKGWGYDYYIILEGDVFTGFFCSDRNKGRRDNFFVLEK